MARLNVAKRIVTHEGAPAYQVNSELQLRRSVMACMLWEKQFYESGEEIADRIKDLVAKVKPEIVAEIAIEAREAMKLRHVPLLVVREMARLPEHKKYVAQTLERVIQRPDELSEFLAIYWKDGRQYVSHAVQKGLARAFRKFDEYSLAKYNRDGAVKLRDVLFLCHAKPWDGRKGYTKKVRKQIQEGHRKKIRLNPGEILFAKLTNDELTIPDTWEVAISATKDKKAEWTRLLKEKKLGALALIRNLRNFKEAGVDDSLVRSSIVSMKTERVLPFRFIAAARYAPHLEDVLETAMFKCLTTHEKLKGSTCLLVDVSGSMDSKISSKSEMTRLEAACGLAMLLREVCDTAYIATFSDRLVSVPPRRGFALRDAIDQSQSHSATYLGQAIAMIKTSDFDRIIVITDEQSHDAVSAPKCKGYMINVASNKNGVGYGAWQHIDGWSEAVVDYIQASEAV